VREKVAPKVSKALANAAEASKPARKEAKHRRDAALAALRGEVAAPKSQRRRSRIGFLLGAGAVTGAVVALVVRRKEPAYTAFEPTNTAGGADPYARPLTEEPPRPAAAPITTMNDEIGTDLNAARPEPTATTDAVEQQPGDGEAPTSIDVTGEITGGSVDLGNGEAAAASGRHRKRTRRGEPE
jgi:hypothetical protein